ncbi:hypothetical protein KJ840_00175 [Patescibacteria group bacterium]|nr:hypothetical protein [Patescibacteria group bacterium]
MDNKGQFSLKLIQKCPVCNHDYLEGKIQILEEADVSFLAYLTCGHCHSSIIVRVMTLPHGMVGNAILTDLSSDEVGKFSEAEVLNSNEVLQVYQELWQSEGFLEKMKQ